MSALSKLKLVTASRPVGEDPIRARREKLSKGIEEQIAMINAITNGESYTPTITKQITNPETGEVRSVQQPKRIRTWFWSTDNGKMQFSVRYGNRILELAKGKSAVEVADYEELMSALQVINQACVAGDIDDIIGSASTKVRSGFKK